MKINLLKHLMTAFAVGFFLVIAFGSEEELESLSEEIAVEESSNNEEGTSEEQNEPEEESEGPSIEYKIGQKITSDVYESNENGLKTYLKFEGSDGSGGMFGSLTLSNNATSCKYVYTYSISGNSISTEFMASDCGASSSDQTYTYNEGSNSLSCYIGGQKFTFYSIF